MITLRDKLGFIGYKWVVFKESIFSRVNLCLRLIICTCGTCESTMHTKILVVLQNRSSIIFFSGES